MSDVLLDIAQVADDLTNPIRQVERIVEADKHRHTLDGRRRAPRRIWVVTLPSLLEQLQHAVIPGEVYDEAEHARQPPGSRPAARLDAIAAMLRIDIGAGNWCNRLDLDWRTTTTQNIRALVGAAGAIASDHQTRLLSDLRAWYNWAAVTTGWERPPDAPRGTCPACSTRNTIRVRLATQRATCINCGAWWDHTTIGILAAHIASPATSTDTTAARAAAVQARRADEQTRINLAGIGRPDLPYVSA